MTLLLFALSASLGAMARFALERNSVRHFAERVPWGTLAANVVGSFILGWALTALAPGDLRDSVTSFCGAFTTFGGFVAQTHSRLRHRDTQWLGYAYFASTIALSLGAAWLGLTVGGGRF